MSYTWQVVAPDWNSLTDYEKIQLFDDTNHQRPDATALQETYNSGGAFKIAIYDILSSGVHLFLKGRPITQLVKPTVLVPLKVFDQVLSISIKEPVITGATVKVAITLNMTDYYTFESGAWVQIDLGTEIETKGLTPTQFNSLSQTAWNLLDLTKGIGIAYSITTNETFSNDTSTSPNDVINVINAVEVQGKLTASWRSQLQGTVYDYEYVMDDLIKVYFYQEGNYKINYCNANDTSDDNNNDGDDNEEDIGDMAYKWSQSTDYKEDSLIYYDENLYRATANFTSGTTFDTDNLEMLGGRRLTTTERETIAEELNKCLTDM